MSALWRGTEAPQRALLPLTHADLDAVAALERQAYPFPWSRGNFIDSVAAGHPAQRLCGSGGNLIGYFVAMAGVDEMHLLNITVAPACEGRGHARFMIDALVAMCRVQRAATLWLEVREGNARARAIYEHIGFVQVGVRTNYYPAPLGQREHAVVMSLPINAAPDASPQEPPDALV